MSKTEKERHICGISGGKDSAALAIYLKEKGTIPDMEYYFADTGYELPETYDFIDRLEDYLGKEITRIGKKIVRSGENLPFEHHLEMLGNMLPSPQQRWCTVKLKLEPFEQYVGSDYVFSYIAIRADEHREGYISTKKNIRPVFPFIEDDIVRADVFRILEETVGIPSYYRWRSRSGCYFCFFQRLEEWIGLYNEHPDLFRKAAEFEKYNVKTGKRYTWVEGQTLDELLKRKDEIIDIATKRKLKEIEDNRTWQEKMLEEGDIDDQGCLICSL